MEAADARKHLPYSNGLLDEPVTRSLVSTCYLHMLGVLSSLTGEAALVLLRTTKGALAAE